jgi:hypothetical protein
MNFGSLGAMNCSSYCRWWCTFAAILFCTVLPTFSGWAWDPSQPETLQFRVAWGPLSVGKATLHYQPPKISKGPYTIEITAKDSSALIDMNNRWTAVGIHPNAKKSDYFSSRSYHALQHENDYRADKIVTFNYTSKTIVYHNRRDPHDTTLPIVWDGQMRDVLSALYTLRNTSLVDLKKSGETRVMGPKRPFVLIRSSANSETLVLGNRSIPVWRIQLSTRDDTGKAGKGKWIVKMQQNGRGMIPLQIIAQTKFGTFTATRQ